MRQAERTRREVRHGLPASTPATRLVVAGAGAALVLASIMAKPSVALADSGGDPGDDGGPVSDTRSGSAIASNPNDAETQLNEKTDVADDARQEYEEAAGRQAQAQADADAAADAVTEASAKVDAVQDEAEATVQGLQDDAQNDADQATDERQAAEDALAQAQQDEADAQQARDDATVDYANKKGEYETLASSSDETTQRLSQVVDAAQSDYDDAVTGAELARQELDQAQAVHQQAQQDEATAKSDWEAKDAVSQQADQAVADAQALKEASQSDLSAAEADLRQAEQNLRKKQAAYDTAKLAYDTASANAPDAQEYSSVGFFESVGSSRAAGYLTSTTSTEGPVTTGSKAREASTFASHTHIGDENDATSLANVLEAIRWVRYCNQLRAGLGLPELLITDELMASAERNANFSTDWYDHARTSGNVMNMADYRGGTAAENLFIATYGMEYNYQGWFYEEKALWESLVARDPNVEQYWLNLNRLSNYLGYTPNVGHYFSLANPVYKYTGIGLNTTPYNGQYSYAERVQGASIQQFRSQVETTAYTADAYEQRVLAYYNQRKAAVEQLQEATAALESATEALGEASDAVALLQPVYDEATATHAQRTEDYYAAVNVANAQRGLAYDALDAYEQAQRATGGAEQTVRTKQAEYEAAVATVATAQANLTQAQEAFAAASTELTAAKAAMDAAAGTLADADDALVAAQQATADATTTLGQKQEAERQANARLTRVRALTADAALAGTITDTEFSGLNQYKARLDAAEATLATARQALADAQDALGLATQEADERYGDYLAAVAEREVARAEFDRLVEEEASQVSGDVMGAIDLGGGSATGQPSLRRVGRDLYAVESLPVPTKDDYDFKGLFTSDGTLVVDADGHGVTHIRVAGSSTTDGISITAGTPLVARWEKQPDPQPAAPVTPAAPVAPVAKVDVTKIKVTGVTAVAATGAKSVDVSWDQGTGVPEYQVQWRKAGGKWKSASTKATKKRIKGLSKNGMYEIRIRAKSGSATGSWSGVARHWVRSASKAKASGGKSSVKVSWKRDKQANAGYVIYVYSKKGGKPVKSVKVGAKKTSKTIKGLKRGTYYVRIRPVRSYRGAKYSGTLSGYAKAKAK